MRLLPLLFFFWFSSFICAQDTFKSSEALQLYSELQKKVDNDEHLTTAYQRLFDLAKLERNDTLIFIAQIKLSDLYFAQDKQADGLNLLRQAIKHSEKTKNTKLLAKTFNKLGHYYYGRSTDSSFFYYVKAEKLFREEKDYLSLSGILYDIAVIYADENDYVNSINTSILGLRFLDSLPQTNKVKTRRSFLYDGLGYAYMGIRDLNSALDYFNKTLELTKNINDKQKARWLLITYNNIGNLYREFDLYRDAIDYFENVLNWQNIKNDYPVLYAVSLTNYAHSFMELGDFNELPQLFFQALEIAKRANESYAEYSVYSSLAEYYHKINKYDSALYYGHLNRKFASQFSNDDVLESLKLLGEITKGDSAKIYYQQYLKLSDSVLLKERRNRNKLARIHYETDKITEQYHKASVQRLWLLAILTVVSIVSVLVFAFIKQRSKNKQLVLEKKQQETNEEIYQLLLSQHDKIEEARIAEKKRISADLHDGVLSRLFGTRISLDSLNISVTEKTTMDMKNYLGELKKIEQDIRQISHELSMEELSSSSFTELIKALLETHEQTHQIPFTFKADNQINWEKIPNDYKINIYRIIQEITQNIIKHAKATRVAVSFKYKKATDSIHLSISDNGIGFKIDSVKKGIGINNIYTRVNTIKGQVRINSELDKGTKFSIFIPNQPKEFNL